MNSFSVLGKERNIFIALMALGLICLGCTYMCDDANHTRFWSNVLHNTVFFTGIAFMALFFIAACITAWAGWHTVFKRVWESFSLFLFTGLILMAVLVLGMYLGWHHLYHWADAESVAADVLLQGKSKFLNFFWFGIIGLVIVAVGIFSQKRSGLCQFKRMKMEMRVLVIIEVRDGGRRPSCQLEGFRAQHSFGSG